MATILEFKSAPRPTAASMLSACGAAASAEIVLFPGVRYERDIYERSGQDDPDDQRKALRHRNEPEFES